MHADVGECALEEYCRVDHDQGEVEVEVWLCRQLHLGLYDQLHFDSDSTLGMAMQIERSDARVL